MIGGMTGLFAHPPGASSYVAPLKKVFISYSHQDRAEVDKLVGALQQHGGFKVIIDVDALPPGKSIHAFIRESVREAHATISIISKSSLLSTWVALETLEVLQANSRFFGCYVDKEFLSPLFADQALDKIDSDKRDLGRRIKQRIDADRRFSDLYEDIERCWELRSNFDKFLVRLRATHCLSLHPSHFSESLQKLTKALQAT